MTRVAGEEEGRLRAQVNGAAGALLNLGRESPELSTAIVRLVSAVADEACRSPRFARALAAALNPTNVAAERPTASARKPRPADPGSRNRRAPGRFDPFAVFRESSEAGLRAQLASLEVDELKDIISEHGMDYDKLAMRWRVPARLQDRIVERVKTRETKGDAFR